MGTRDKTYGAGSPCPGDVVCGPQAHCAWSQTPDVRINGPAPRFSLKIVLFLWLLLNKTGTDVSSRRGNVQVADQLTWRGSEDAAPRAEGREPCTEVTFRKARLGNDTAWVEPGLPKSRGLFHEA